jgi:hypothetical protein
MSIWPTWHTHKVPRSTCCSWLLSYSQLPFSLLFSLIQLIIYSILILIACWLYLIVLALVPASRRHGLPKEALHLRSASLTPASVPYCHWFWCRPLWPWRSRFWLWQTRFEYPIFAPRHVGEEHLFMDGDAACEAVSQRRWRPAWTNMRRRSGKSCWSPARHGETFDL